MYASVPDHRPHRGLCTWSTFTFDPVTLWERGKIAVATGYVLASLILPLILSLFVIAAVLALARRWP